MASNPPASDLDRNRRVEDSSGESANADVRSASLGSSTRERRLPFEASPPCPDGWRVSMGGSPRMVSFGGPRGLPSVIRGSLPPPAEGDQVEGVEWGDTASDPPPPSEEVLLGGSS